MLHAFRVRFGNIGRNTYGREQSDHKPVPGANSLGKFKAGLREENAAVRSGLCQTLTLQAPNTLEGGWMSDTKPFSHIGRPGLAVRSQQIGN